MGCGAIVMNLSVDRNTPIFPSRDRDAYASSSKAASNAICAALGLLFRIEPP
jgi:hypothetical protein